MRRFIFVGLFLIFTVSTVFSADYDEIMARYKVWPMASAAFSDNPGQCVKDNYKDSEFKRQYTVQCDIAKEDTCSGFTAVSHSDKAIIISLRGSRGALQITNEVIDELFGPPSPFVGGGGVSKYFLDGFTYIWNAGMKDDFLTLKNANPDYELWVTGHSLGAAMACIAAATVSSYKYMPPEKIKLITYGEPRVGNSDYVTAVDTLVPYAFRIIHAHDLVPHLPPKGMLGYYHHKTEVWYNNNMAVGSSYVICTDDEGSQCSDSTLDLNPKDHDFYFNVSTGFAKQGCAGYNPYH